MRVTMPADQALVTFFVARSTRTMPLFSCSVTAATPRELIVTYSGSGSRGVSRPAAASIGIGAPVAVVNDTFVATHDDGLAVGMSTT